MLDTEKLYDAVGGNKKTLYPKGRPDADIVERFRRLDAVEMAAGLTDLELWDNYVNDDLYAMDKKVRELLKSTRYRRQKSKKGYRTTAPIVFAWIYGRRPDPHDTAVCRMLNTLLMYYCTSYTGQTTFGGKRVDRVYEFSPYSCDKKRPYSLRLRMEEAGAYDESQLRKGPGYKDDKRRKRGQGDSRDGVDEDG